MPRKLPASKLDALKEAERDLIFAMAEGLNGQPKHTLAALIKFLDAEFGIKITDTPLSTWLQRRRGEREFSELLGELHKADGVAHAIAGSVGRSAKLGEANAILFSNALLSAKLAKNEEQVERAAEMFAVVVEANSKAVRAQAAKEAVSLQRGKLLAQLPELLLKALANEEVRKIANSTLSHAEKITQLRTGYFASVDALEALGEVRLPE